MGDPLEDAVAHLPITASIEQIKEALAAYSFAKAVLSCSLPLLGGRSIVALELDEHGRPVVLCDCGTLTVIVVESDPTQPHEFAITCDGCTSLHWLMWRPASAD